MWVVLLVLWWVKLAARSESRFVKVTREAGLQAGPKLTSSGKFLRLLTAKNMGPWPTFKHPAFKSASPPLGVNSAVIVERVE
jgi:hypothetical protein